MSLSTPAESSSDHSASTAPARKSPSSKQVLIAEDSTQFRYGIRRALETAGYGVLEASTGEEALDIITDERIDVLVLDLVMPGLNGVELLRELRKRPLRGLHIIAMSGAIAIDEKLDAMLKSLGVSTIIQKPFDLNQLVAAIG